MTAAPAARVRGWCWLAVDDSTESPSKGYGCASDRDDAFRQAMKARNVKVHGSYGVDVANELIQQWHAWKGWYDDGPTRAIGVPVWHLHESIGRLQRLARTHTRVALGSSGQWPDPGTPGWWVRMGEAMEAICINGAPITRLHGLRMLDPEIFQKLPLSSADSTNPVRNSSNYSRFGQYLPPRASTRMGIIAERVELLSAAAVWIPKEKQGDLFADFAE